MTKGNFCKRLVGKKNWSFWLGFSLDRSRALNRSAIIGSFGAYTGIVTVLGLIIILLIRQYNLLGTNPAHSTAAIGTGNISYTTGRDSVSELARLARSLNTVAANLQKNTIPQAYLETIVDSNKDPLLVIDQFGRVAASNQATSLLLGYSRLELLGMPATVLFSLGDQFAAQGDNLVDLLETNQLSDVDLHMLTKEGEPVSVRFRTSVTQGEDSAQKYFVATAIGLTIETFSHKAARGHSQESFARNQNAFATFFGRHDNESLQTTDVRGEGREYLEVPLIVYDSAMPNNRGWVHNISERGLGLVGVWANVNEKKKFLIFSEYSSDLHPCEVEAVCQWIKKQAPDDQPVSGFEINEITEENRNRLIQLVPTLEVDERLRREERMVLDSPLTVYEATAPGSRALVRDMSDHGLRLLGMNPTVGTKKKLILETLDGQKNHRVEFEAVCRWVRQKTGEMDSDSGFEITAFSSESFKKFLRAIPNQPAAYR